jgi:hypothetical protein
MRFPEMWTATVTDVKDNNEVDFDGEQHPILMGLATVE